MKMSPRSQKLAGVIEEKISFIIQQFVTPDQVGFLTVRSIEVSGDLGVVDVFVHAIGAPENYLEKLQSCSGKIAHSLSKQIELRRVPQVRFKIDKSVERMEKLK